MRVALTTLGCRLNQSETDAIGAALRRAGHRVVAEIEAADVVVINSCTITHQADADVRQLVRRAARRNPAASVVVTGCYANAEPDRVASLEGVHAVVGNGDKARIPELLQQLRAAPRSVPGAGRHGALVAVSSLARRRDFVALRAAAPIGRTRALLKVQDGCNYRCSFCIVPRVRGPSRSLGVEAVGAQLDALVGGGAPEVVLTGIHLGTYGRDLRPRRTLADLVRALILRLGSARLRLSSLDPHEVTAELIDLMAANPDRICRHLHLPVQSGDPGTLRRMRRGHTAEAFADLARELARRVPGIAIGTDVIVGFPGEDDPAFARTHDLLERAPVAYHHVFTYSQRRGTAAASMPDQVRPAVKTARNRALRELSERQARRFRIQFAGATLDAVLEPHRNDRLHALTDNYLRLPARGGEPGRRATVRLDATAAAATVL